MLSAKLPRYLFIFFLLIMMVTAVWLLTNPFEHKLIGKPLNETIPTAFDTVAVNKRLSAEIDLLQDKKIVCLFSLKCVYCRKAAQQLSIFADQNQLNRNVYVFFAGREVNVKWFFDTSGSTHFNYEMIEKEVLSELTDGVVPKILLVENGIIREFLTFEELNEIKLTNFFGNEKSN